MLSFERTTDTEPIRSMMTHAQIYPFITDDGSPSAEDFAVIEHPSLWYVLVKDGEELLGLFLLHPRNLVTYEIHTCLLPSAWGARAALAAQGIVAWFFGQNPQCERIVTSVPGCNRLALRFAKRAGMTEYGVNPKSFLKGGTLFDQHLLGLSRPQKDTTACQQQPSE